MSLTVSPILSFASYELFLVVHVTLGLGAAVVSWYHIYLLNRLLHYGLMAAVAIYIIIRLFRICFIVHKNISISSPWGQYIPWIRMTKIALRSHETTGLIRMTIYLPRPCKVLPGQYVHVQIPSLTLSSWMQSHPFAIVSWSLDHDGNDRSSATSLHVIVKPKNGWTKHLAKRALQASHTDYVSGLVHGPFGYSHRLDRYNTVLLFATDFGIFPQLTYLKTLLERYDDATILTRKVKIFWQIKHESIISWPLPWMQDFLDRDELNDADDRAKFLEIFLHVGSYRAAVHTQRSSLGRRLHVIGEAIRCDEVLNTYLGSLHRKPSDKVLILICAHEQMRGEVRHALYTIGKQPTVLNDVDYSELEFQPDSNF